VQTGRERDWFSCINLSRSSSTRWGHEVRYRRGHVCVIAGVVGLWFNLKIFTAPGFWFSTDFGFGRSVEKSSHGRGKVCGITRTPTQTRRRVAQRRDPSASASRRTLMTRLRSSSMRRNAHRRPSPSPSPSTSPAVRASSTLRQLHLPYMGPFPFIPPRRRPLYLLPRPTSTRSRVSH
jgi:hypothetical protein